MNDEGDSEKTNGSEQHWQNHKSTYANNEEGKSRHVVQTQEHGVQDYPPIVGAVSYEIPS